MGGFLRWQAGGEEGLAPWFTGERALPEGACPAARECRQTVAVSAHLPGARLLLVAQEGVPEHHAMGGPVAFEGFERVGTCKGSGCGSGMLSSADALDLRWQGPASLRLAFEGDDWSGLDVLSFRVAAPGWDDPTRKPVDVLVGLADGHGASGIARASEHSTALLPTPDPRVEAAGLAHGSSKLALQAVRIPLSVFGVDLASVAGLTLEFHDGTGRALVTDILVQPEPDVG